MKLISLLLAIMSSVAFADGGVGNGGNVVACYTDSSKTTVTSITLFDYWEGSQTFPQLGRVDLGSPDLSVLEKIEIFTSRVKRFDPTLGSNIDRMAQLIAKNIDDYLVTGNLPETDDYTPKVIPTNNCFIEQFAVQWRNPTPGNRRFSVARKFYDHKLTSNDARAGLILHEAIYRDAIAKGHKNSDSVREYNFVMANKSLNEFNYVTAKSYLDLILKNKLNSIYCSMMGQTSYFPQGFLGKIDQDFHFSSLLPCINMIIKFPTLEVTLGAYTQILYRDAENNDATVKDSKQFLAFFGDGKELIDGVWMPAREPNHFKLIVVTERGYISPITDTEVISTVIQPKVEKPMDILLPTGELIECSGGRIYNDQQLIGCTMANDEIVPHGYGSNQMLELEADNNILFDKNYNLIKGSLKEPGRFRIYKAKSSYDFWLNFELNPTDGSLVYGKTPDHSGIQIEDGRWTSRFSFFRVREDGLVNLPLKSENIEAWVGAPILYTGTYEGVDQLCVKHGYRELIQNDLKDLDVTKPQDFYNAELEKLVTKIDEPIKIYDEPKCTGYFWVKPL